MKGNEFSKKTLSENVVNWIKKLHQLLVLKEYGKGTLRNYVQEMILLLNPNHAIGMICTECLTM